MKNYKIKIILINALRYLEFLRDNHDDLSIFNYNCLVIEAETAIRELQNKNITLPIRFKKKSLQSNYVSLRKMINLPQLKDKIFDIDDLCIVGNCVTLNSKYYRDKL